MTIYINGMPKTLALFAATTTLTIISTSLSIATSAKSIVFDVKALRPDITGLENEDIEIPFEIIYRLPYVLSITAVKLDNDMGISYSKHITKADGNKYELKVYVRGYVGSHRINGLTITFQDIFKLFRIEVKVGFGVPVAVHIVPVKTSTRFRIEFLLPSEVLYESYVSRRKGYGINILGVREYTVGDEFRRIAWKATAKTGRLMVKEYEGMSYRNIVVVASLHNGHYIGDPPPIHYIGNAVLGIVSAACERNMKVRVGVITEEGIKISSEITKKDIDNVHTILSLIEWPLKPIRFYSYSSSNRIVRWFVKQLVFNSCREPCIVALFIDPLDDLDVENIARLYRELKMRGHELKLFLAPPTLINFLYNKNLPIQDLDSAVKEINRIDMIVRSLHRIAKIYTPDKYIV
ncbi:MAG: DUF58 domain-containing protein [Ignisphaera sp.]